MKYKINGIELDTAEILAVHKFYEARCTADFILENYDTYHIDIDDEALSIGYAVREEMLKLDNGEDEIYCIEKVLAY